MATISTHVLNMASGRPAPGIAVALEKDGAVVARGTTDADGRVKELASSLAAGRYRLVFDLGDRFFRRVALDIEIGGDAKYHVPVLVSPYGVTTYRGS
ncbi:MAG TPA: hydroxyisourate hydrolase [Candidatus Limnocylindria bacterium]|jgi:5-hydroxyisourate hydrolase|nr:hydroxyisourate hydrolase [Candidatus Limnocylindria bacterium]